MSLFGKIELSITWSSIVLASYKTQ